MARRGIKSLPPGLLTFQEHRILRWDCARLRLSAHISCSGSTEGLIHSRTGKGHVQHKPAGLLCSTLSASVVNPNLGGGHSRVALISDVQPANRTCGFRWKCSTMVEIKKFLMLSETLECKDHTLPHPDARSVWGPKSSFCMKDLMPSARVLF